MQSQNLNETRNIVNITKQNAYHHLKRLEVTSHPLDASGVRTVIVLEIWVKYRPIVVLKKIPKTTGENIYLWCSVSDKSLSLLFNSSLSRVNSAIRLKTNKTMT